MLVVGTAPGSVEKRIIMAAPGAPHHSLFPCLMETQVGCVNETTQDEVCEVGDKVIKCHPAGGERKRGGEVEIVEIWVQSKLLCDQRDLW